MAKKMIDISLDENEELNIEDGDLAVTESTAQHQQEILLNAKGDFKENPTICVNAFNYLDGENFTSLMRAVAVEFCRDGIDVENVGVDTDGQIKVSGAYV